MLKTLTKWIIRRAAWAATKRTVAQVLPSRCRREGMPEHGRFTRKEIRQIISQADLNVRELMPHFTDRDSIGNYQNAYAGLLMLAIYRALLKQNIARNYAVSLVGDMQWQHVLNAKGLIPIIDPLRNTLRRLTARDSMTYLEKRLKGAMKYPYSKPGYRIDFYKEGNVYCMDIYSCPVYDFYKQFGEEEMTLFRRTHCTFDYTAAEHLVEGGKYQRRHTLSDGDEVCDMRWSIDKQASI